MIYDIIIIGAGPAGLTASIYASRYKLSNLAIGKLIGGTITYAHKVENFPGVPSISGTELGQKMAQQAKELGAEILIDGVKEIQKKEIFKVITESGKEFSARTIIITTGTERRKLNIPGEKEYLGKGVSYCTTCDAPFFKDKAVILVGGSNAACSGALHLADYAKKVFLIYRKNELRAEPVWVEEVKNNPKIEIVYATNLTEILGEGQKVVGVKLDVPYNGSELLKADGVFIEAGGIPASQLIKSLGITVNENDYIKVDERMRTNIEGIFAAGDVTTGCLVLSQAITASAHGAVASNSVFEYLKSKEK